MRVRLLLHRVVECLKKLNMEVSMKPIPYGLASYKTIREENYYYVDKTHYIPQLEATGKFLFFIRPRRFGKSSWLTVLECYYDINRADEFDFLFKDTYICDHPTPEKNRYLILNFNFSEVNPQIDKVEESFNEYTAQCFLFFGLNYQELLGDRYFKLMEQQKTPHGKLNFLLKYVGMLGHKVYILVDEYDNFTNTILSTAGQTAYHELTHGAGFFRFFFSVLKGAADKVDTGIGRMFITGVSPVTMDDVTSGFNIGQHISLYPELNEFLGFTKQDVIDILEHYGLESAELLPLMLEWYDNYRFSSQTEQTIFNTNMVLYFIKNYLRLKAPPEEMIDQNVKTDYSKLRHLMVLERRLNGNFSLMKSIIETQETKHTQVVSSFPVEYLTEPENFVSLLFYFGLLSHSGDNTLRIPNQTVKQLMYSYLRRGYDDVEVFNVDIWRLIGLVKQMAYQGEWRAVFEFLAEEVEKQTAIRDYLTGEKVIQTFLLAYLNVTDYYLIRTEEEMGKGFVDLYLEPFFGKYANLKYSYLIEIKYITRQEFTEGKMKAALAQAKTQLQRYATDARVVKRSRGSQVVKIALVFAGWELKAMDEF